MATTALLIVGPAQAARAGSSGPPASSQEDGSGLPFSTADLGWVFLAGVLLLVLAIALQVIARRRRRRSMQAVTRERTDP